MIYVRLSKTIENINAFIIGNYHLCVWECKQVCFQYRWLVLTCDWMIRMGRDGYIMIRICKACHSKETFTLLIAKTGRRHNNAIFLFCEWFMLLWVKRIKNIMNEYNCIAYTWTVHRCGIFFPDILPQSSDNCTRGHWICYKQLNTALKKRGKYKTALH